MPLGIERLETVDDLFTSRSSFQRHGRRTQQHDFLQPLNAPDKRRILGGVQFDCVAPDPQWRFIADRDGMIDMMVVTIGDRGELKV